MMGDWQPYAEEHFSLIRDKPGVYVMYSHIEGDLIYIGHSRTVSSRIKQHDKSCTFIKVKYTETVDEAQGLEAKLIAKLKPELNRSFTKEPDPEDYVNLALKIETDLHRALKVFSAGNGINISEGAYTILKSGLKKELNYIKGYDNG